MPNQNEIREAITNSNHHRPGERFGATVADVLGSIGKNAGALPTSSASGSYRGLEPDPLGHRFQTHGFTSKWWGTFQQWKCLGGRVMPRPDQIPPGKWGTQIMFWAP